MREIYSCHVSTILRKEIRTATKEEEGRERRGGGKRIKGKSKGLNVLKNQI